MVGIGNRWPPVFAVHHQHRTAQTVAHPHRAPAFLPRPRLDDRTRRTAADLPAAAGYDRAVRRTRSRRGERTRDHRALSDPALQMVHPLRLPGQPAYAHAVARWADHLDVG